MLIDVLVFFLVIVGFVYCFYDMTTIYIGTLVEEKVEKNSEEKHNTTLNKY